MSAASSWAIAQLVVLVVSTAYSMDQQRKMKSRAKAAAEARKGFALVVDGSVEPLPIVYGRAKIGGVRSFHATDSSYRFSSSNADKSFNTGGKYTPPGKYTYGRGTTYESFVNYSGAPAKQLVSNITGTKNEFLFFQQAICQGPINNIYDVIINESQSINDPSFGDSSSAWVYKGGAFVEDKNQQAAFRVECHYDGGYDAMMASNFGDRKSATFTGLAYLSCCFRLDRDEPQFQQVPTVQSIIEGRKVKYIIRSGSPGAYSYTLSSDRIYTTSPPLCLLDYLMDPRCGRALQASQVDLESFYKAMTVCDIVVQSNVPVGGRIWKPTDGSRFVTTRNIPLYECNIIIDTAKPIRENVEALLTTMGDSRLVWSQGRYRLLLQYPANNAAIDLADTISDDDILHDQPVEISWPSASSRLNSCTVRFQNESEDFKDDSVSWPPKQDLVTKRGIGGKRYATMSGWDKGGQNDNFMNSYGVWDGGSTFVTLTYKFVAKETGVHTITYTGDDSISLTINGTAYPSKAWPAMGTSTISLTANTVYTVVLSCTDTGGYRGIGATIVAPSGVATWTTRSETYDSFIDVVQSNDIYETFLAEDNGVMLESTIYADGICDYYHALAKAEEMVRISRSAVNVKLQYRLTDKYPEPGDIIKIESEALNLGMAGEFYIKLDEIKIITNAACEISGTRFDYTQLAWNQKDFEYLKPPNIYSFGIAAPSSLTYIQGNNALNGSPGTLTWDVVNDPAVEGYILYFHKYTDLDAEDVPIFNEIGRKTKPPFLVPNLGTVIGTFGVASFSKNAKSRITAVSVTDVIRIDDQLDPPNPEDVVAVEYGDFEESVSLSWEKGVRSNSIPYIDHKFYVVERAQYPDPIPLGFDPDTDLTWESLGVTLDLQFIDTPTKYGTLQYRVRAVSNRELYSEYMYSNTITLDPASANGFKSAVVYAFKRYFEAPSDKPGDVTYTFADSSTTAMANDWHSTIPSGTDPVYITAATAASNGEDDIITNSEWSTPQLFSQAGLNTATVFLYQRSTTNTPPDVDDNGTPAVYTFGTATLTSPPAGWTQGITGTGGFLFIIQATAISGTPSDSIPDTEWSEPSLLAQDGTAGRRTAYMEMYKTTTGTTPTTFPSGPSTYTWADSSFTDPTTLNGWSRTSPALAQGDSLWAVRQVVTDTLTTATSIAAWTTTTPIELSKTGANGSRLARIQMYKWSAGVPSTYPSGTSVYTWATGLFTAPGTPNDWTLLPGEPNPGESLWAISMTFTDNGITATSNIVWSSTTPYPVGAAGATGNTSALVTIYQRAVSAPTLPSVDSVFTFATGAITGLDNGWSATLPTGALTLWASSATAYGSVNDMITPGNWATPQQLSTPGTAGLNNATVYLYQRTLTGSAPSGPTTALTYTFADGSLAGSGLNGWSQTMPSSGGSYRWMILATASATTATDSIATGEWTPPVVTSQDGVQGDPGNQSLTVYLYQWASTSAGFSTPGNSTFTWSGTALSAPSPANGWSVAVPANPGTAGLKLYRLSKQIIDISTAITTTVNWPTGTDAEDITRNGADGTNGYRTAKPAVYQWAISAPSISGNSTYTWATGGIGAGYSGAWTTAQGSGSLGQTLWRAEVNLANTASSTTSNIDWTLSSITAVGYNGTNGSPGGAGSPGSNGYSARRAYALTTSASLGSGTVTSTGFTSLPANGSYGANWSASPSTPTSGQVLYQSDGIYNPNTNQISWETPYISALKVGQLAALAINTGDITIDGNARISGSISSGIHNSSYSWSGKPAGSGFHLSSSGILMGSTANSGSGGYLEIGAGGNIYMPGFSVVNGSATFSGTLSAASGTFSGTITASTITGGTVQTASSGQRVVMAGSTGSLRTYDSGGTLRGHIGEYDAANGYAAIYGVSSSSGVAASFWGNRSNGYSLDIRNFGGTKNSGLAIYSGSTCAYMENQGDGRGALFLKGSLSTSDILSGVVLGTSGSDTKLAIGDSSGAIGTILSTKNMTISASAPSGGSDGDIWIQT